jgi:hypothetical protein
MKGSEIEPWAPHAGQSHARAVSRRVVLRAGAALGGAAVISAATEPSRASVLDEREPLPIDALSGAVPVQLGSAQHGSAFRRPQAAAVALVQSGVARVIDTLVPGVYNQRAALTALDGSGVEVCGLVPGVLDDHEVLRRLQVAAEHVGAVTQLALPHGADSAARARLRSLCDSYPLLSGLPIASAPDRSRRLEARPARGARAEHSMGLRAWLDDARDHLIHGRTWSWPLDARQRALITVDGGSPQPTPTYWAVRNMLHITSRLSVEPASAGPAAAARVDSSAGVSSLVFMTAAGRTVVVAWPRGTAGGRIRVEQPRKRRVSLYVPASGDRAIACEEGSSVELVVTAGGLILDLDPTDDR